MADGVKLGVKRPRARSEEEGKERSWILLLHV
jgi:hypothetical protein